MMSHYRCIYKCEYLMAVIVLLVAIAGCQKNPSAKSFTTEELYGSQKEMEALTDERKDILLDQINQYLNRNSIAEREPPSVAAPSIKGIDTRYHILLNAILSQDKEVLKALEATQISLVDKRAQRALYSIIDDGRVEAVEYLIGHGILKDINTANMALYRAVFAKRNRPELIKMIVEAGISDVNGSLVEGYSPLSWSSFRGYSDSVEALISLGANVNEKATGDQSTPLHIAARYGHYEVAKVLLEKGADYRMKDESGKTPLEKALESTDFERESFIGKNKIANLIREYIREEG